MREHHVVVVDAGAQLAARVVRPQDADHIVEIGSGRGSKTFIMAGLALMAGRDTRITAIDNHDFKLTALDDTARSIGLGTVSALCADATSADLETLVGPPAVDRVLVDAPCSGLGTLRRHPDRRWRAQPAEIDAVAALGSRLLESAASLVAPDGFVVYSTCTIARRENAEVIGAFLASPAGRGFVVDPLGAGCSRTVERAREPGGVLPVAARDRRHGRPLRRAPGAHGPQRSSCRCRSRRGTEVRNTRIVEMLEVTEAAALAAGRWMGKGDKHAADDAAVEGMRQAFNEVDIAGTIVIGEGERDEAPMLFIGEKVGRGGEEIDIAVDPLEGTNLTAYGQSNSLAVLAFGPKGTLAARARHVHEEDRRRSRCGICRPHRRIPHREHPQRRQGPEQGR